MSMPPELTDQQCDEFRRLPLPFNDMVRAIHTAGFFAGLRAPVPSVLAGAPSPAPAGHVGKP